MADIGTRSKPKSKPVHLKDLLNDLRREDAINTRIKMQLKKRVDQPRSFNQDSFGSPLMTASAMTFTPITLRSFLPPWNR
jgi:hypothetical protein